METSHVTVSDMMLIEKAESFVKEGGISVPPDFKFSRGWLCKFKKRHGIASHKREGEAASADMAVVTDARKELQETLDGWDPELIYNMDETGLFFHLEPSTTLATGPVQGKKKSKERLTVALCANATGTHKLKPLVIGKSKKPRCFGAFQPSVFVHYRFNKKAWMMGELYKEWLEDFNRQMRLAQKKVLLLLDNASSHTKGLMLSNVTVKFLPPNTTSHIQPMDAGIIRTFKAYYGRLRNRHYVRQADANEKLYITVKDAITYTYEAWRTMAPQTIKNCWNHTRILPSTDAVDEAERLVSAEINKVITDIDADTEKLGIPDPMSARDLLTMDETQPTEELMTDQEIVNFVAPTQSDACSDDEEEEAAPPPTSTRECQQALETLVKYCGENSNYGEKHIASALAMLKDIRENRMHNKKQTSLSSYFASFAK